MLELIFHRQSDNYNIYSYSKGIRISFANASIHIIIATEWDKHRTGFSIEGILRMPHPFSQQQKNGNIFKNAIISEPITHCTKQVLWLRKYEGLIEKKSNTSLKNIAFLVFFGYEKVNCFLWYNEAKSGTSAEQIYRQSIPTSPPSCNAFL